MKQKMRFSLGKKLTILIVLLSVTLSLVAIAVSYWIFSATMTDYYERLGTNLVRTLASQLDPDELDHYYETGEMDGAYYDTQSFIRDMVDSNDVEYLYVVRPHGVGVTFLFDSDMEIEEGGTYADGGYCALGTYVDLVGAFAENLDKLLSGEPVEPIVQWDESYGWLMTAMTPVLHADGTMAGYVMADISMNDVMNTRQTFLIALGALLTVGGGFLDAYTYFTRGGVFSNAQTGNLVLLAIRLAEGDLTALPRYLPPILAFALGVVAAELVRDRYRASHALHWRQAVVALEALILLATAFLPQDRWDAAVNAAVSFVCAMQVESFRKIRGNAVATTMCTGNLRSGTALLFHGLHTRDRGALRQALQYYGIILFFILGAALGVWCTELLSGRAALVCCLLLLTAFCSMFIRVEEDASAS